MAYQEKKTIGYGTRLSNSIKGIGTGFLLIFAATALLWWNEGRAVKTSKMLKEAQGTTVHVEDVSKVDPSLNGKLIHATAFTRTTDSLSDETFRIGAVAVRLDRNVQYYQWVESQETHTEDKLGGSQEQVKTYTYSREWVGRPVNSREFKDTAYQDRNFVIKQLEDKDYIAENVTFGAYRLPENLIRSISGEVPVELGFSEEQLTRWNQEVKMAFESRQAPQEKKAESEDTAAKTDSLAGPDVKYVHVNGNVLYFGKDPGNPQIGDMSISFTKVLPGEYSVIAEVNGNNLQSYVAKNGKTLSMLTSGAVSMEQMYQTRQKSNSILTWILRIVGLLLVVGGFKGIFGIITTLLKVLPALSDVVGLGVGLVCKVLGLVWSLLVIAIAWLAYRPVIAGILLAAIIALVVFLVKKGKDKKKVEGQAPEAV